MNRFRASVDPLSPTAPASAAAPSAGQALAIDRPIVLVGMMGAGKTSVGRRLAEVLSLPFRDADEEIEKAAGLSVSEIFERHGEAEFRRGERQVIKRLLEGPPHVLAAGGGAFMDSETRAVIKKSALSIWLRADLDVLMRRVLRRPTRPLLQVPDPRAAMSELLAQREPVYAEADLMVHSNQGPQSVAVQAVLTQIAPFFSKASP
ncbi:MAG: shikimate kinase [Alphaproteobacteria bacterium]|nr:shikimate kinase [Alphaproteobacteria bacterium]